MNRLDRHPDCSTLSFHEERALPWITRNGGLSSNVNAAITYAGTVDGEVFWRCLHNMADRYDALRTRFIQGGDGEFRRHVVQDAMMSVGFTQLQSGLTLGDDALGRQVADFCNSPVSIDDPYWVRASLIHTEDGASVIVLSTPHIVSDAVSIRILISHLWKSYAALAEGEEMDIQRPAFCLRDFAGSQRAWAQTPDFRHKFDALTDHVSTGIARVLEAGREKYAAPPPAAVPSATIKHPLSASLVAALEAVGQGTQAGLPSVLIAGTALTLAKLFDRREFCFRLPFANRSLPGAADIVGFLSNDVPMFVSIDPAQGIEEFIHALRKQAFMMTTRFGAIPWSLLTERLKASAVLRDNRNPFDDYLINLFPAMSDLEPRAGYHARNFPLSLAAFTNNDLKVWWHFVNDGVIATLKVGTDQEKSAEEHYVPTLLGILQRIATGANGRVGDYLR